MTTIEAAPTVTSRSTAICGSSESVTRTMAWAAKAAMASSVMALVALPRAGRVDWFRQKLTLGGVAGFLARHVNRTKRQ